MKKKLFYTCTTALDTDIAMGADAIRVYVSQAALKRSRDCWKECGITEIEVKVKRTVRKQRMPK